MVPVSISPFKAVDKAYYKIKPDRTEFNNFKNQLIKLIESINDKEGEEHNKNLINYFLQNTFYKDYYVNTKDKTDLAVYLGKTAEDKTGIIIETKRPTEKYDMVKKDNLNAKAMHEAILYYLQERIEEKNDEIKHIIITNAYEWFIFNANEFEKLFYKNKQLVGDYKKWRADKKVSSLTEHFYNEIAKKYIDEIDKEIPFAYFDLRDYLKILKSIKSEDEKKLIPLFKLFSVTHLLKESFLNDSNQLNKQFYQELLYIIGLEETKDKNKKVIGRRQPGSRDGGALIENTIRMLENDDAAGSVESPERYGENKEERIFNIALELNLTWINRVLFLKLLEAQLVNYHGGDNKYKFLDTKTIEEYDDLYELFHEVLAKKVDDRSADVIEKFKNIPYLNSSLFEQSELEKKTIRISNLKDRSLLPIYKQSVLKNSAKKPPEKLHTLEYLLMFLDAFDFASDSAGDIQEENKNLINASVLGRIFEKINGYKEGSFFTPGFITMYMAKETLRRGVLQKFNDVKGWGCNSFDELKDKITDKKEANEIINSLKICDPAVGSGHFLVSVLNELLAIKSDLDVLCYRDGTRVRYYKVEVANDELSVYDEEAGEFFEYTVNEKEVPPEEKQKLQEALFHEKETIIENCLFGVDINPNSVNICRLRLWIELLKNAYYTKDSKYKNLETLPNIDINIKEGNSLISRFDIKEDIFTEGDKRTLEEYKLNVQTYKNAENKETRNELKKSIDYVKKKFKGIAKDPLRDKKQKLSSVTEQLHELNKEDLFSGALTEEEKENIESKRAKLTQQIEKHSGEIKEAEAEYEKIYLNAFEWRFEFPEVLDEEGKFVGFDVVIGNPPWGANFSKETLRIIKENNKDIIVRMIDSFMFFINRAFVIKNTTGFSTMIVPDVLLYQIDNQKLREKILKDYSLDSVINLGDGVFEDVARPSAIFSLSKKGNKKTLVANYSKIKEKNILQTEFLQVATSLFKKLPHNIFATNNFDGYKILSKIIGVKLASLIDEDGIQRGVSPDLKEAFIVNKSIIEKFVLENEKLKPTITGGVDLLKYQILDVDKQLIYTNSKDDLVSIRNIVSYINSYKDRITCKEVIEGKHSLYSLHRPREEKIFNKPEKIIGVITGDEIITAIDENRLYPTDGLFLFNCANVDNRFILGILNSRLLTYFYRLLSLEEGRTLPQIKPIVLEELPIVINNSGIIKNIISDVDAIIKLKKRDKNANTDTLEKEIDRMVYKLYGLTEEEIRIVENV